MAAESRFFGMRGCPWYLKVPGGRLYERNPVTELYRVLTLCAENQWRRLDYGVGPPPPPDGAEQRLALIYGPPGTSSESAGVPVVWVRCDTGECYSISNETTEISSQSLEDILAPGGSVGKSILVFDGILDSNKQAWIPRIEKFARGGVPVILVSSEGVSLNEGTFQNITIIDHRVPGWTLQEYEGACDDEEFFNAISVGAFGRDMAFADRYQLISEKFFVAGHSARWMFRKRLPQVNVLVSNAIATMRPNLRNVEEALRRPKFAGSVNGLMSWLHACNGHTPNQVARFPSPINLAVADDEVFFPDPEKEGQRTGFQSNNSFVSVYVARKMLTEVNVPSGDLRAMGLSIGEQSIVGYAFQQRFLELTKQCRQAAQPLRVTVGTDNVVEEWTIGEVFNGGPLERLGDAEEVSKNLFIWAVGNTAAYDAIHIYGEGRIRFIQVTSGKSHSLKLYAAAALLRELEARGISFTNVDFVVVRPSDDARHFSLDLPIGSFAAGDWLTFHDDNWATGARARDQVRKGAVAWV